MKRDLPALASRTFDVIVVGGGIAGISVARDAAERGLSVALLERHDFASGSTGATVGMIHGGIRCLQRLDLGRLRALSVERNALLRNASHLVHTVPVAVPTYGRGRDGKSALHAGFGLYDVLTAGRNQGIVDPSRRLADTRTVGRDTMRGMFPGLPETRLTGGVIFTDAQLHHPVRLALALLRSAVHRGAQAANGLEVTGIVRRGITVTGVGVRDRWSSDSFVVRGRTVVNTAGAWAERILEEGLGVVLAPDVTYSRRASLIVDRRPPHRMGLALLDESRDSHALLSRSKHHLFILPRRDHMVLGEWHMPYSGRPEDIAVTDEEVESCVDGINERYPGLRLHSSEVVGKNAALVLVEGPGAGRRRARDVVQARFIDHAPVHGTRGIMSLRGATWGTARLDAVHVVDEVFRKLGEAPPPSNSLELPVHGGDLESLDGLVHQAHEAALEWGLTRDQVRDLVLDHGTGYEEVFDVLREAPELARLLPGTRVLRAEVLHAVRMEMALTLADLAHHRTDIGLSVRPGPALEEAAHLMGTELGWSADRVRWELDRVESPASASVQG